MPTFPFEVSLEGILGARGKVFTAKTLDRLVECTRLREFEATQN